LISFVIDSCTSTWQCLDKCTAAQTLLTFPASAVQTSPNYVGGGCSLGTLGYPYGIPCQVAAANR